MDYIYDITCNECGQDIKHSSDHWITSPGEEQEVALKALLEHYKEKHTAVWAVAEKKKLPTDMNVLPGQRIGWDKKSEYLGKLADYSANGYLTQEEWDARVKWVNDAATQEDIDAAFSDLKLAELKASSPKPASRKSPSDFTGLALLILWTVLLVVNTIAGDYPGIIIGSALVFMQLSGMVINRRKNK